MALVLVFGGVVYVQVAILCLAILLCLLVAFGFVWHGHRPRAFWISLLFHGRLDDTGRGMAQGMRSDVVGWNHPGECFD
jgi:hypothetical protein